MSLPLSVDLKGKVALVTGGGGVLGSYFCRSLAEAGAKVAVLNRTKSKADKVVSEIVQDGGKAIAISGDVLSLDSLKKARKIINKEFGTVDILVNAAGGNHPKGGTTKDHFEIKDLDTKEEITTFFDLEYEGLQFVFNLNFLGTLLPTQVFAKDMLEKEDPTIINISSMAGFTPMTRVVAYGGAKAAVSNFTNWLAVHFAKVGIRVNAIAPGFFLTEQNRTLLTNEDGSYTERANKIISQTPMDRFGDPEDLIGTLLWLADSKASGFVNGTVIPVDGGFQAYSGV
ncbi:SDR family oxidoreductase [Senegalia massiliensis]|uniref:SDR family NAD(P)-dependent oxidoreductase n=1 Tax=Senegalia massiliensis TaxID=1720316 RepID=A0A845R3W6_9CLOT|nr:SDR family oxidoreductase [Senegalia massiliensis]NBI07203.1 SDR family NAD(P)-dependent oxidoreductase [Senegalia massiliensis]